MLVQHGLKTVARSWCSCCLLFVTLFLVSQGVLPLNLWCSPLRLVPVMLGWSRRNPWPWMLSLCACEWPQSSPVNVRPSSLRTGPETTMSWMCGVSWTAGKCTDFLIFFADHNVVFLLPLYKPVLRCHKPQTYSANQWLEDAMAQLQGPFACIDWDIFESNLEARAITDYIKYCISILFQQYHSELLRDIQTPPTTPTIVLGRNKKPLNVWTLTGCDPKPKLPAINDPISFTDDLNTFHTRFDTINSSEGCRVLLETLPLPEGCRCCLVFLVYTAGAKQAMTWWRLGKVLKGSWWHCHTCIFQWQ